METAVLPTPRSTAGRFVPISARPAESRRRSEDTGFWTSMRGAVVGLAGPAGQGPLRPSPHLVPGPAAVPRSAPICQPQPASPSPNRPSKFCPQHLTVASS